jgi:chromosome segregation ATPase
MGSEEHEDIRSLERKFQIMEQKIATLELRINTTEETNLRLYNKWNGVEERFQQQQIELRSLSLQCQNMEQRIDTIVYDRCERLDDDIIIV